MKSKIWKTNLKTRLVLMLSVGLYSIPSFSQNLKELCTKLNPNLIRGNGYDLVPDSVFFQSQIIGLGENCHGSKAFFEAKNELIKKAVKEFGYRLLWIEAEVSGTETANSYIVSGIGKVEDAVFALGISAWMTNEMAALLDWLKSYNRGLEPDKRVRIMGIDCKWVQPTWNLFRRELEKNGLAAAPPEFPKNPKQGQEYAKNFLSNELQSYRIRFDSISSEELQNRMKRLSLILEFCLKHFLINEPYAKVNFRDECMYRIIQIEASQEKQLIWAHNEHITLNGEYPYWVSLGERLKKDYGKNYFALGLVVSKGWIGFYNQTKGVADSLPLPEDSPQSYAYGFGQCTTGNFFLNLRNPTSELSSWIENKNFKKKLGSIELRFDQKSKSYQVEKVYQQKPLYEKLDGLIYIPNSGSPSRLVFN